MIDHTHYTYRTTWSEEDGEYIALCVEFPSLSWLEDDPAKAMKKLMDLVKDTIKNMEENGESPPEPLATRNYSGKFMLRIPPEQHKTLALLAAEQGISLNRYVSSKLI